MSKEITHYGNLQVVETASPEAIRGSYKYLSQKWHPDKNPENRARAEKITKILNEAYGVLSDPQERAEYDARLKARRNTNTTNQQNSRQYDDSAHEKYRQWDKERSEARNRAWEENQRENNNQLKRKDQEPHKTHTADQKASTNECVREATAPIIHKIKWLKFWCYVLLPIRGLSEILGGILYFESYSAGIVFGAFIIAVACGIHYRQKWAWEWNWVVIIFFYITSLLLIFENGKSFEEQVVTACLMGIFELAIWIWPNYVYWNKRADLFINIDPLIPTDESANMLKPKNVTMKNSLINGLGAGAAAGAASFVLSAVFVAFEPRSVVHLNQFNLFSFMFFIAAGALIGACYLRK